MNCLELSTIGASESQLTIIPHFVDNIEDEDFSVAKELLQGIFLRVDRGETSLNTKECYDSVESRQRMLNTQSDKDMEAKARKQVTSRAQKRGSSPKSGYFSDDSSKSKYKAALSLPPSLFRTMSRQQKQAFKKWREAANNGEQCDDKEIASLLKRDNSSDGSEKPKSIRKSKKSEKIRALKIRREATPTNSSTNTEEVQILVKSDDEHSSDEEDGETTKSIHRTKIGYKRGG